MSASTTDETGTVVVSARTGVHWLPMIGLEVHVQLATRTKLFCGCETSFGDEANTRTCPVCTGQPGALPVLNAHALELAVRAALAVGAEVSESSKFDRKNYYYPDLPKGYQITQYDRPYCSGGGIQLASGHFIRLRRIHLEEDAGKTIHDRGETTLVDLNRAGTPLIESVTEADLRSAAEAAEYLAALKEAFQYAGVSDCDMEKGSLRCDVNVSVRPEGEGPRTRVEIKNLNSFRFVQAAIEYETSRQIEAWEADDPERYPVQETRLWDPERGVTRPMRGKEDEADYRYFPEPDLPGVRIDPAFIERQRSFLPESAAARRHRYVGELGLSDYDAGVLTASRAVADFFESTARASRDPKQSSQWIQNEVLRGLSDPEVAADSLDELPLRPHDLAEVMALVDDGTLHRNAARTVLDEIMRHGGRPLEIVEAKGLRAERDEGRIEDWCREALESKPHIAEQVRAGNDKALGALIGPVMQASKGAADPKLVREVLARLIREAGA